MNRSIGKRFVDHLLEDGARKAHATAHDVEAIDIRDSRVIPLRLDLLDEVSIKKIAVVVLSDLDLLINNAGITTGADLPASPLDQIRADLKTHLRVVLCG